MTEDKSYELNLKDKIIIGFATNVIIYGSKGEEHALARVDSGARTSSLDIRMAAKLNLGPIVETRFVKSASGQSVRPIIKAKINVNGKDVEAEFTVADRKHLQYPVLIGRNILEKGFIIDPNKKDN